MDALAFATLGFASDGGGAVGNTAAVVFADVEIDGIVDAAAIDMLVDAAMLAAGDTQTIDIAAAAELTGHGAASPESDVEIDTCP